MALFVDIKPIITVPIVIFAIRIAYGFRLSGVGDFSNAVFKRVGKGKAWFDEHFSVSGGVAHFTALGVNNANGAVFDVIIAVVILINGVMFACTTGGAEKGGYKKNFAFHWFYPYRL